MSAVETFFSRSPMIKALLWACAYIAIAAALIGANPFRGETTGPFDRLASYQGWNPDGQPVEVRNPERSDILDALLPAWIEARRQIHSGALPLWNPLPAGGRPALLDPVTAELTVGFALFAATPDPALGFYLAVLSSMVIAGLGMHRLIARYCSTWPAVFGGVSYMACGFITAWLFWPHTHSAMWIPWLLVAVDSFCRRGSNYGFIGISIFTALMFLGGFPFVVALGLGAALVHALMTTMAQPDRNLVVRRMAGTGAAIGLGFALVAIPLLSFVVGIGSADMGYRHGGSALHLADARLLAMPWAGRAPAVEKNMYVGMAALLLAALGLLVLARGKANRLAWSGAIFVLVGATLTFGLLPREIGAHLPVLSNNPWSRAILLLDMGLILLGASGMDALLKHEKWGRSLLLVGALICVIQGVDLGRQFRKFNGATPSRYFYPVSPELALLAKRVKPFQYVAQDSSYFVVSGTLGAIGLGEWFGHSLRSPQLHNLLDALARNPFSSPTATSIRASDFHLSDDLADVIGLCYVVFPTATNGGSVIAQANGHQQQPLSPINNLMVTQSLRLTTDSNISAIAIRMANYRGHDVDGTVTTRLNSADGHAIGSATLPAADIADNQMATFHFENSPFAQAGDYTLQLNYVPGPRQRNLTAWILKDVAGEVHRGDEVIPGSLTYMIFGARDPSLSILTQGPLVTVAENPGCAKGPYWTADLTDPQPAAGSSLAKLIQYEPDSFTIKSTATSAGFIVVPMQHLKGWKATVDGRPATIQLVEGVLPSVPVPAGTSSVQFVYRPPNWRIGLVISTVAALILAWVGGIGRKRPIKSVSRIRAGASR